LLPFYPQACVAVEPNRDLVLDPGAQAAAGGSFTSRQDLKERIERFIDYFNRTMAKPFKWTKTGKPLAA